MLLMFFFRVENLAVPGLYVHGILELAKQEKFQFTSLKTILLTGQPFSAQFKQDVLAYLKGAILVKNMLSTTYTDILYVLHIL